MEENFLSRSQQEKAKQEIAESLGISKKFIEYDFKDRSYFIVRKHGYDKRKQFGDRKKRMLIRFLDISLLGKYAILFVNCDFKSIFWSNLFDLENEYHFIFESCNFYSSIHIDSLYFFVDTFTFINCHFFAFIELCLTLKNEVSFENCIFHEILSFKKTVFENKTSFYGSTFKKCPIFSEVDFRQPINLVNTKLQFDYDVMQTSIIDECAFRLEATHRICDPHFIANDLRNGFVFFKNSLGKEGNSLDTLNYHKMELYCKEIELTSKQPAILSKEWIDKVQLWFYRLTSDHHTDILQSFNSLIALIGVFGLLCGAIVLGFDYFAFDYKGGLDILSLKEAYSSHIKTSIQSHTWRYFLGNLALVFMFIGLFFGVVWKCSRDILIALGYVMTLGFLATSPKYLIPAMSLFGGSRAVLDPLGIVGGVYTLLFGFLAYSFIKTIRKNSIIPS